MNSPKAKMIEAPRRLNTDICSLEMAGIGIATTQRSVTVLKAAQHHRKISLLMQVPGSALIQFFETGKHSRAVAKTKAKVPVTMTAMVIRHVLRMAFCGKIRR